ncbi:gamma-glutamyltranspeptidase, partial [Rozella allomycis CSF55]
INHIFGSKLIDPQTGIMLNNEMDDFSQPGRSNAFGFIPNPNNYIEPLKRPQSSMAPIIIEREGQPWIVTGGSGGSYIISAVIQVLLNIMTRRMLPQQAIEEPRLHHQLIPNIVKFKSILKSYMPNLCTNLLF